MPAKGLLRSTTCVSETWRPTSSASWNAASRTSLAEIIAAGHLPIWALPALVPRSLPGDLLRVWDEGTRLADPQAVLFHRGVAPLGAHRV
jgi:hypothetical protein